MKFSRAQISWILYDMANAAFALIVRTVFAPMFYKNYAAVGMDPATATSSWGLVSSAAGLLAGILAPWLGAMADAGGGRRGSGGRGRQVGAQRILENPPAENSAGGFFGGSGGIYRVPAARSSIKSSAST